MYCCYYCYYYYLFIYEAVYNISQQGGFYGEELLSPRPTFKMEDHPLAALRD
jgi:hypothetical protein